MQLPQPMAHGVLVQRYKRGDAEIIDISIPLVFSKTPLGTLYVGFGTGSISAAVNKARKEAGVITAVMGKGAAPSAKRMIRRS